MIKDYILDYAIAIPKRFNKYEKASYIEEVLKIFKDFGYKAKLALYQDNAKNAKNIIIGNLEKAKIVLVTNYDTPSKVYTSNYKYYPFSSNNNIKEENKSLSVQSLIVAFWILVGLFCFYLSQNTLNKYKYVLFALMIVCLIIGVLNIRSKANKANMTRNSASIALMMDLARTNKKELAFILLDKNANSYIGINEMDKYLKEKCIKIKCPVINLDCVAYGKKVVIAYPKNLEDISSNLKQYYSKDNIYLKEFSDAKCDSIALKTLGKQIKISVGDIDNNSFYVRNTRTKNDVHINVEQLIDIEKMISEFVASEVC